MEEHDVQEDSESRKRPAEEGPSSKSDAKRLRRAVARPVSIERQQQAQNAAAPVSAEAGSSGPAAAVGAPAVNQAPHGEAQAQAALAAEELRLKLTEAAERFAEQRHERMLWLEVDLAARLGAHSMAGRHVRVLWPDDAAWYLGTITAYNAETGEHTVQYADGEQEEVVVALERVRLLLHAGERLAQPDAPALRAYAAKLRQLAGAQKWQGRSRELAARACELEQLAAQAPPVPAVSHAHAVASQPQPTPAAAAGHAGSGEAGQAERDAEAGRVAAPPQLEQPSAEPGQVQQQVGQERDACGQRSEDQHLGNEQEEPPQQQQHGQHQGGAAAAAAAATRGDTASGAAPEAAAAADAAAAAADASEQQPSQMLPGEVGWFQVKGYPHWPFMVITREEAVARGLSAAKARSRDLLPVLYFGMGDVQCVNPRAVDRPATKRGAGGKPCFATFLQGLERGYHAVGRCRQLSNFKKALFEVVSYFQSGELPPCMLPWHNDGLGAEEDEGGEEEEGLARPAAKKRRGKKAADGVGSHGLTRMPLHVNAALQVLHLGEVEWLHPAFHNEKRIFPVGYRARRLAKTPASGQDEVPHLLEVLRAPNGSGPLFRVTPEGGQPVEGPTATKAWQALFASDVEGRARSVGISGDVMFGLAASKVERAIRALPGAGRCDRYCGWPDGEEPAVPPLSDKERRERLACETRMQLLPEGIRGVPVQPSAAGVCHVCGDEEEDDDDVIVQCSRCHVFVHMSCYGITAAPHGSLWLCDVCSLGVSRPPACVLCPVLGGALKRTSCGRWAHPTCATWLPELELDREATEQHLQGIIVNVREVQPSRFQLKCRVCQQKHGACFQCCDPRCYAAFHPLCARQAGYEMRMTWDYQSEDEEEGEAEGDQQQQGAATAQQPPQSDADGGSCNENDGSANNASGTGHAPRGGRKRTAKRQGTVRGNVMLTAFCPRHGTQSKPGGRAKQPGSRGVLAAQQQLQQAQQQLQQAQQQQKQAPAAGCAPSHVLAAQHSSVHRSQHGPPTWQQSAAAAAPAPAAGSPSAAGEPSQPNRQWPAPPRQHPWASARAAPCNHAARRGQRAPEAVAAAEAKRGFVRSTPYLVGGPLQQDWRLLPRSWHGLTSAGGRWEVEEPSTAGGAAATSAACAVQQARGHGASVPAAANPSTQGQLAADAVGEAVLSAHSDGAEQPPVSPCLLSADHAAEPGSPLAGQARLLSSPTQHVKSEAVRFREMLATQGQHVTIGKSGIHGWGAFAKQPFKAHDMVIEYVGELVRPSMSDLRERQLYDATVGAGTYVFSLNNELNVDATRAGNLAHILNHSCAPNCFSRTISIREGDRVEDHVVIFAKQDIQVGEELTYNYRFRGEEQLPCNCGAATCTGLVNEKPPNAAHLVVPRSQLRPWRPPRPKAEAAERGAAAGAAAAATAPAVLSAANGGAPVGAQVQAVAAATEPAAQQDMNHAPVEMEQQQQQQQQQQAQEQVQEQAQQEQQQQSRQQ